MAAGAGAEEAARAARVAHDAVHLTQLSAAVFGAKLDTVRRNIMGAAKTGFTSQLLRVEPRNTKGKESPNMAAIQQLKARSSGFEVRCVSVDSGPQKTHSYLVRWGSIKALPGARRGARVGVPPSVERSVSDEVVEMTDAQLYAAASEASQLVGSSSAAVRGVRKGNPVRNAVLSASRQGYSCVMVRVVPESDNEKAVEQLAAAGLNVVLVSVDADLEKAHSFLVYWGAHWGTLPESKEGEEAEGGEDGEEGEEGSELGDDKEGSELGDEELEGDETGDEVSELGDEGSDPEGDKTGDEGD